MDGLQRIFKMVIILYVGFQFAAYNQYVVNTFSVAPLELGQSFFGASDTSTIFGSLDSILGKGFEAGKSFGTKPVYWSVTLACIWSLSWFGAKRYW